MLGKSVQEITITDMNWAQANDIVRVLMENDYVVMVSREEDLIVINYVYDDELRSDRNGVAFMPLSDYEDLREQDYKEVVAEVRAGMGER